MYVGVEAAAATLSHLILRVYSRVLGPREAFAGELCCNTLPCVLMAPNACMFADLAVGHRSSINEVAAEAASMPPSEALAALQRYMSTCYSSLQSIFMRFKKHVTRTAEFSLVFSGRL